jgi:hypothetical protein
MDIEPRLEEYSSKFLSIIFRYLNVEHLVVVALLPSPPNSSPWPAF